MRKTIIIHVEGLLTQHETTTSTPTPLEQATTPNLDELAGRGEMGQIGVPGESRRFYGDLALLALLGYDPQKWYAGPGPFEAAGLEVNLDKHDVAFLCDFITLRSQEGWGEGRKLGAQLFMDDAFGVGIDQDEAREFFDAINDQLVSENIQFYFGHHHRHLMVWAGGGTKVICRNPREALGNSIEAFLPTGDGGQIIRDLMEASRRILIPHTLNQERINSGLKPVNCLWVWGPGKALDLPKVDERWPVKGIVVSSEGSILGVGALAGLPRVRVDQVKEEVPEWLNEWTRMSLRAMEKGDFVFLHLPTGAMVGKPEEIVKRWEEIDTRVIGPIRTSFLSQPGNRLLVTGSLVSGCLNGDKGVGTAGYMLCEAEKETTSNAGVRFHERVLAGRPFRDATKFLERLVAQ